MTTPGYHPYPDDGKPLTRQWLTTGGGLTRFVDPRAPRVRFYLWHDRDGRLTLYLTDEMNDLGQGWWTYIGREIEDGTLWVPAMRTRGDLRRLIVAVGG